MASLSAIPKWQVLDGNGLPLAGAKLSTYLVGTSTPTDTYTDYTGGTVAAWPLVFDSEGRAEVWLGSGSYKMVLTDSLDNIIWTVDGVSSGGGGAGTGSIVNTIVGTDNSLEALEPNASTLVTAMGYRAIGDEGGGSFYWDANITADDGGAYIKPTSLDSGDPGRWVRLQSGDCNVRWWGCYGSIGNNDTTYMTNAITYATAAGKAIYLPEGTYDLGTDPGFVHTVPVVMAPNAVLRWTNISNPAIMPVIGVDDYTQHFDVGSSVPYPPKFQAGATSIPQWFASGIGTGATDDWAAVETAVASVRTNGGTCYIPKGTYCITSKIQLASNVVLKGDGASSVLKAGTDSLGFDTDNGYMITQATATVLDNVQIKDVWVDGALSRGDGTSVYGIGLNLRNSSISRVYFHEIAETGIVLGKDGSDSSNVKVEGCYFMSVGGGESGSFGGVEIVNGYNIDIKNNNFQNVLGTTPYNPAFAVNVKPDGGTHGVRDVVISDNQVNDSDILVASDTSYPALATNITVTGNTMDGDVSYTKSASIKVGCAYGTPAGGIKISDNEIEIFSTGIAIELTASSDSADYYEITNNRIQCGDSVGKGISINGQTAPVNIDGNHFSSKNINTQPAIDDNNASTPITFGTNTFYNYPTKYDVGSGHVCYLGDKFDSTIGGDTSCHANMVVNNNLTVLGNVVNTTISNLLQSMITGLNTGTRPYNSDSTDFVVTTGTAGTKTLSGTPYMTTLSTDMTKSISASSTWSAGNMGQARPSGVTMYGSRIYHMFLLGKSSDPTAADIGIDSVPKPVNLLADSGVVSAGYNTYRRVGSMKWGTYSWPDSTTVAQYVSGFWTNGDTHWERIVSPYVQFDVTTANAFSYHQPDLPSNIPITAILVVTSDKEAGQSVLLGATTNKTNQAIFTDPAIGEYQEFYIDTLDATVWGDFNVYGGSGSMSVYSGVSGWIDHRNKDRTDNF